MKFKKGWYKVEPYFTAHFFHNDTKSVCGIEFRKSKAANKSQVKCDSCQRGTGGK